MLSTDEQASLTKACSALPPSDKVPVFEENYVLHLVAMALDFQLQQETVDKARKHFDLNHSFDSHVKLRAHLGKFDNSKDGNLQLARSLWGNNHWTRAAYLRALVERFEERGIDSLITLSNWASNAEFKSDVEGQFKIKDPDTERVTHSMGYTMFQYLRLRTGHDTVKPDSNVLTFVESAIRRKPTTAECVQGIEAAAKLVGRSARALDAAIYRPPAGLKSTRRAHQTVAK